MNILKHPMKNTPLQSAGRQLSLPTGNLPPPCYLCRRETGKSFFFTFSGITHSRKSGKCTDADGVRPGIKSAGLYGFCTKKWRCFHMGNPNFCPMKRLSGRPAESRKPWTKFYGITASVSELPPLKTGISTEIPRTA